MDPILDLLLPKTDTAVLIQLVVVLLALGIALWRFWSNPDLRLLVIGAGLLVLGLMGLRSLH